ncbi:Hypothetical predicted protein [Mytilus galloprovincialis]|uniref:Uncharacterized protein n=1 Tax=Mytilus galloprovincialis TaxID=29158 RepID=A0A8B6DN27_MYTGA|nr:Hypothetical predicted protein [Mytilus galloprovincialis]
MKEMHLENRLKIMENQMIQNMCIQTALTTQMAIQNKHSIPHHYGLYQGLPGNGHYIQPNVMQTYMHAPPYAFHNSHIPTQPVLNPMGMPQMSMHMPPIPMHMPPNPMHMPPNLMHMANKSNTNDAKSNAYTAKSNAYIAKSNAYTAKSNAYTTKSNAQLYANTNESNAQLQPGTTILYA